MNNLQTKPAAPAEPLTAEQLAHEIWQKFFVAYEPSPKEIAALAAVIQPYLDANARQVRQEAGRKSEYCRLNHCEREEAEQALEEARAELARLADKLDALNQERFYAHNPLCSASPGPIGGSGCVCEVNTKGTEKARGRADAEREALKEDNNHLKDLLRCDPSVTIEDGFGSAWSRTCPTCGLGTMHVNRPGEVQCDYCG